MGKRATPAKGQRLTVDDFKLQKMQRAFHDAYTAQESDTYMNANASALSAGYTEAVAKNAYQLVPTQGATVESSRSMKPIQQAIFWTLYNRTEARRKVEERTAEASINGRVLSRQYIEKNLMEIVERCMGHEVLDEQGRDLAKQIGDELARDIVPANRAAQSLREDEVSELISKKFKEYASRYRLFRPTQAKEAMRLLGIDIGMFIVRLQKVPETSVDTLTPAQLESERARLEKEWRTINAEVASREKTKSSKEKGKLQ